MKKALIVLSMVFLSGSQLLAQSKTVYSTVSGEMIFSFASIEDGGSNPGSILRFSPVFNFQNNIHMDRSDKFGIFTGINVRNVGFIYDIPGTGTRKKYRTYNLGIPIAFKVGDMDNSFFYAGYELEIPFNYKEKTFQNEEKTDKFNVWFSSRTPTIEHALFAGFQLPYGSNIKFKYYLTNFFNKGYTETDPLTGLQTQPYANINVNVFYFALSFPIMKAGKFYYDSTTNTKMSRAKGGRRYF